MLNLARMVGPLLVVSCTTTLHSAELTLEAACSLLADSDDEDAQKLVARWQTLTGFLVWKDDARKHSVEARYVSTSDDQVTLERRDNGRRIVLPIKKLAFAGRVRVRDIEKLKAEILTRGTEMRTRIEPDKHTPRPTDRASPSTATVETGAISSRQMSPPDSSGDVWYSVKVDVKNPSPKYFYVSLYVQAVDKDGFELATVSLASFIPPRKSFVLTDRTYMAQRDFDGIDKWRVKGISARETAQPKVTVSDVATRLASRPDSSGDIWFSIKANIRNNTASAIRSTDLQAVDKDGFELYRVSLRGDLAPDKTDTWTRKTYMPVIDFERISQWRFLPDR